MHKSCKGNHLHLFHPDRLQPESLTCLIYFCCSQLSKMLDWSSVTFGSWLKKKMTKLDVMLIVIMKYAFAHGKHFKNTYGMKGQNSIFQIFFFVNFSFLLHINFIFWITWFSIQLVPMFPILQWAFRRKVKQQFKIPNDGSELWHGEFLWHEEFGFIQHR